jgi:hypothetical protein
MRQADDEHEELHRELQRRADRLCSLIVASDYPAIDVVIEIRKLRDFVEEHFPDRMDLFERIYESRFKRLWEQFRSDSGEALPEW